MLVTNGKLVTWSKSNQILENHAILIQDGVIREIAPQQELLEKYPQEETLDARGQYVMPGNICAHTHFYGAYARGMAIPGAPAKDFPEILQRLWWPLDKALDADAIRASALVCLVDAVKHGTTTLIDHHASPNHIDGSLDIIARAVDQAGLRAVLCYEVTDRDGREKAEAGIAENLRFIRHYDKHPRIRGTFGLHASLTLNDETLRMCADSHSGGFHIHVAEHEADEEDSLRRSRRRVVHRLEAFGIWNAKTIAAHCVHIDEHERQILLDKGVWVSHQPRSNMNNAVGALAFDLFLRQGIKLCLGNDGFSNNMWAEWKDAYLLHKVANRDPRKAGGYDIVQVAVYNNAALVENFFSERRIGQLTIGAQADMMFVDYHPYTPLTADNLPWHILFGFEASMVTTTMVDGNLLMRDRKLLTLDEQAIAEEARALAPRIWDRYASNANSVL